MQYLAASYDLRVVAASVLIAAFASFVTLDLAKRVRTTDRAVAMSWLIGGSFAMGTAIWSMHFVGMMAFSLPIAIGYTKLLTFLSWVAAVAVSAVALGVASRGSLTLKRLGGGSVTMGAGICVMHYTGMAALDMAPGIVWDMALVAASAVIAMTASAAALLIFFWLRRVSDRRGLRYQFAAAVVMGLAISGMHYTGMAAASFPQGSVCLSADSLGGDGLGTLVGMATVTMLVLTLFTSILDARMQGKTALLADSLQTTNVQLQEANEELRRRAFLDPLTELPNRLLFEDRLTQAVGRCERAAARPHGRLQDKLAVLFIDLDGFKPVNDSFGHAAGDLILKEVAARLRAAARASDTPARVGGDEFLLLMEDVGDLADCMAMARRLVEALAQPFDIAERHVMITGSIGIVVYPDHCTKDKLVAHADAAMYAAKRAGGNTFAVFESHMDARAMEQLCLQNDLRGAVERNELELHYQPKVDGHGGHVSGVEALLRWRHPERGVIGPSVFIPLAERFGLINALGNWVIDEACRQMRAWADAGLQMSVAFNLSVHQLRQDDLVARIQQALQRNRVPASQLLCEITESVAMEDIKATQKAFEGLERIGVFLAIDDFGTGYSSLSYLRQLPAQQLKIDRSFVNDLASSSDAAAVVNAVIHLAHALGLRVVAEGVETAAQRDILLQLGCDELQGYFYAKPMSADVLLGWSAGFKADRTEDLSATVVEELAAA